MAKRWSAYYESKEHEFITHKNKENGFKWIKAAAVGGYTPAQSYLASSEITKNSLSKQKFLAVISLIRNAIQGDNYSSNIMLAWELVTTDDKSLLNPDEALSLLENTP